MQAAPSSTGRGLSLIAALAALLGFFVLQYGAHGMMRGTGGPDGSGAVLTGGRYSIP